MEKVKKQKKAAPAPEGPGKKIKKDKKKKKGKAPVSASPSAPAQAPPSKTSVSDPASSAPARAPLSKPTVSDPAPSAPARIPSANQNGVKATAEGGKKEDSEQRIAGFIFMCNAKTKASCYQHRVFGLPRAKLPLVEKVKKGTKLFLYDYDLKLLYGVYKATSNGGLNLDAAAFNGNFPAQVKFEVFRDCLPLTEATLKQAIKDNYQNTAFFKPELNSSQVQKLLSLFQPVGHTQQSSIPRVVEERRAPKPPEERSRTGGPAYASTQVDLRYAPQVVPHVQNHPYASAALTNRAPLFMDPGLVSAAMLPPPAGAYRPTVVGLPPPNDVYHPSAAGLPHPNDVYHPAAAGLPPPNDVYYSAAGSVYQTDSRVYHPQSSVLLERYRAVPHMIPSEQPPVPVRDYLSVPLRENEVAPRMEHASQYYNTDRVVASTAEQRNNWAPGHESSNRVYADSLRRPISSRANLRNLPVSSLYSFAGAAPAYR